MSELKSKNTKKNNRIRAAQYVRMSTEHQQYSTENQADAIKEYAEQHNIEIVHTYSDQGKSGLNLEGRIGLQELIADVENQNTDFEKILVYDISRWGRFQDADESAYYEYICRRAGKTVEYCAEQFKNDGSTGATIIKAVKRTMAGEYSRELSAKVFKGQCRLIELGFRQGGPAGYGLRRMLIDAQGNSKKMLRRGEHKSLQTDRVILVPGPDDEIETINWIYSAFVDGRSSEHDIADHLNSKVVMTDLGGKWTRATVHQVLTNEKYIGNNVFNRRSFKLKKKRSKNPRDMWIRKDGAFESIVDPALFYKAEGIILARTRKYSDDELLEKLTGLFNRKGKLSAIIIDESDNVPSSSAYRSRFGSLVRAYQLVGYTPEIDYSYIDINRRLRKMHPQLLEETMKQIRSIGADLEQFPKTGVFSINGEFTVALVLARCQQTPGGSFRWKIHLEHELKPDLFIAVRMDAENRLPLDYYVLPRLDMTFEKARLAENNGIFLDIYRFDDLDVLSEMATHIELGEVA